VTLRCRRLHNDDVVDSKVCSVKRKKPPISQSLGVDRWKAKPPCFKVYYRRRMAQDQQDKDNLLQSALVVFSELAPPLQEFKTAITKPTDGLLPLRVLKEKDFAK
jgi:hypothetical protein